MKKLAILGSTGSIGTQALEVVDRNPDHLQVISLAASTSVEKLAEQAHKHKPLVVSVKGPAEADALERLINELPNPPEIGHGEAGLEKTVTHPDVTSVLNGIVGSSGLPPTLTALREGREVLLANKESLVMAGELIKGYLDSGKGSLVPVDSEHSAIYQCLGNRTDHPGLSRIILTASGGPFRDREPADFENLSVSEALSHPTWTMGPKITIDSATMMNKGLEIIEAHYLFGLPPDMIDVVIHPASIVHSLVEFKDGSMLAQMSHPTMEIPIQFALLGCNRRETRVKPLVLAQVGRLEFYPPDSGRFPALDLARRSLELGGTAPAVLNAANEEAVKLFLAEKIRFSSIAKLVELVLNNHEVNKATLENITASDVWAREEVRKEMSAYILSSTNGIK